jgi:hypothetical protein
MSKKMEQQMEQKIDIPDILKVSKQKFFSNKNNSETDDYFFERYKDALGLLNGYKPIATFNAQNGDVDFLYDDGVPVLGLPGKIDNSWDENEILYSNRHLLLWYYLQKNNAKMLDAGELTIYNPKSKKITKEGQTQIFYINPKYKSYALIHSMFESKNPIEMYNEYYSKRIEYYGCLRSYIDSTILGYKNIKSFIKDRIEDNNFDSFDKYNEDKVNFNDFYRKLKKEGDYLIKKWSNELSSSKYNNLVTKYEIKSITMSGDKSLSLSKLKEFIKKYNLFNL